MTHTLEGPILIGTGTAGELDTVARDAVGSQLDNDQKRSTIIPAQLAWDRVEAI